MTQKLEAIPTHLLMQVRKAKPADDNTTDFWSQLESALNQPTDVCVERLGITLALPVLKLSDLEALEPSYEVLSFSEAAKHGCLVLYGPQDAQVWVALSDPFDIRLQTWLEAKLQTLSKIRNAVQWHLVHANDLKTFLIGQEESLHAMDKAVADVRGGVIYSEDSVDQLSLSSIAQDSSPIVRLVNSTVLDAMKAQASDIHIETVSSGLHVKYRIDGVLSSAAQVQGRETAAQVVSRIKVMAELDIAEQRVPQDGRFKLAVQGREIDFRVSVMPSLFGEDVVIRILDKRSLTDQVEGLRLDLLGYEGNVLAQLRRLAKEPYGMLLVTGPTGSGKTTTLYAALTEINSGAVKIVTIEDPIEYELQGILQIPVNEKKGMGFARGLRSVLRHDPDKIFVGEIRDSETAQIAIQSALTGHLVFTSVHANNVFDVLGRFLHLGVDTYSFVSALNGVLAQRLVRVICPQCKEVAQESYDAFIQSNHLERGAVFFKGKGCAHCRGTGFKGRRAISELLILDDELRELIIARAPIRILKNTAQAKGTVFLRDAAVQAVRSGWTTIDEIDRVTFAQ
jgi:general secretion pathway protein E